MSSIGPQYEPDDDFKEAARLHQSAYRAKVLKVGFDEYGNRLTESAGDALLNYYDGLGIRAALRKRYPTYSKTRVASAGYAWAMERRSGGTSSSAATAGAPWFAGRRGSRPRMTPRPSTLFGSRCRTRTSSQIGGSPSRSIFQRGT